MGTTESKLDGIEDAEEIETNNKSLNSPSQLIRRLEIDPRSPSSDIARTPIEVLKTPASAPVVSSIDDPRSPTNDFDRTPIVINTLKKHPVTLHNKILDRARMPQLVPTPIKPKVPTKFKKTEQSTFTESDMIIKVSENKRNSVVGLLETNIDFVETDLDTVIQNKSVKCEDGAKPLLETELVEVDKSISTIEEVVQEDTSVSLNTNVSAPTEEDLSSIDTLNRKLTNLIFEDKLQLNESPVKPNIKQYRPPLHEQNPNSQLRNRFIPVLKVSDKPSKPPSGGSKIPVFRDRRSKGKIIEQCENTPPRIMPKSSQWAAEDSMII